MVTWVKLPDNFDEAMERAGLDEAGFTLFACGLIYSSRNLTDGAIPRRKARRLYDLNADPDEAVKALVDAGLWVETDDGYQVRDHADYLQDAKTVQADRDRKTLYDKAYRRDARNLQGTGERVTDYRAREAKAAGLPVKEWELRTGRRMPAMSESYDSRTTSYTGVVHESFRPDPSRPDPTRKGRGRDEEEGAPSGARALARSTPSGTPSQPERPLAPLGGVKVSLEGDQAESLLLIYGLDPPGRARFERIVRESAQFRAEDIDPYENGEDGYESTLTGSVTESTGERDIAALGRAVAEEFGVELVDNRERELDQELEEQ